MKLTLGYSPCPNDTFIFGALATGKVKLSGIDWEIRLADVETLNEWALEGKLSASKISYHAYIYAQDRYVLSRSGSALGRGCGPLLITTPDHADNLDMQKATVAMPGKLTTAHLLSRLKYPTMKHVQQMVFSDIEQAVSEGNAQAGVIIHENRFTYQDHGLVSLQDLGAFWEEQTGMPIPLGGIGIRRDLSLTLQRQIQQAIRASLEYAYAHPDEIMPYVSEYAQEMDVKVMRQHIDLYVNDYSLDLGEEGMLAVQILLEKAKNIGITPSIVEPVFVQ